MASASFKYLIKSLPDIIPGLEAGLFVMVPQNIARQNITTCKITYLPDYIEDCFEQEVDVTSISDFLRADYNYAWISTEDIPIGRAHPKKLQIELFEHLTFTTLFVRLHSLGTGLTLLCFLDFIKSSGSDGFVLMRGGMDRNLQKLSGYLIYNALEFILHEKEQSIRNQNAFNEQTRLRLKQLDISRQEHIDRYKYLMQSKLNHCRNKLSIIGHELGVNFMMSQGLIEQINNYTGNLDDLTVRIEEAATYTFELHRDLEINEIILEDWHLVSHTSITDTSTSAQKKQTPAIGGLSRTMELLDKLESAAQLVLSNKLKLTSANVGRSCPIPISAPAISDSIKKHRDRINKLLLSNPERWPIIRSRFRPILSVQEHNMPLQERESA